MGILYITSFLIVIFIYHLYNDIRHKQLYIELFKDAYYASLLILPIYFVSTFLACIGGYIGKKLYDKKKLDRFTESK